MADELNEQSLAEAMVAIDQHYKDIGAPCPNATDPSLVERIARAMCRADDNDPDCLGYVLPELHLSGLAKQVKVPVAEANCYPAWKMYRPLAEAAIAEMFDALKDTAEMNAAYPLMQAELREEAYRRGEILPLEGIFAEVFADGTRISHTEDGGVHIDIPDRFNDDAAVARGKALAARRTVEIFDEIFNRDFNATSPQTIAAADETIANSPPSPKDTILAEAIKDGGVHVEFDPIKMDAETLAATQSLASKMTFSVKPEVRKVGQKDFILAEALRRAREKDSF